MKTEFRVAVLDPFTLCGRDVRAVLTERRFPISKMLLFHTHGEREGILAGDEEDEAAYVAPIVPDSLEVCQVAFLCGPPKETAAAMKRRSESSCLAIDLSGLRTGGPFVWLPESADPEVALPAGSLLLTHDPTAAVIADLLLRLEELASVHSVTVSIDRPVSELGKPALDELFQQSIAMAAFRPVPKKVLGTQATFNTYLPKDSEDYEARVVEDVQRIFGRDLPVAVLSARVSVFHGHVARIHVRFDDEAPDASEIETALFGPPSPLEKVDPENLSGPVECAGRDETLVLRVARDEDSVRVTLASDHFRRAGALLAVRIAERALLSGVTSSP